MASEDTPDLDELLFYQQLISNHSDLYTRAQELCSYIVIPLNLYNGCILTRDIFESHLFRPSPCFKGKHVSWNDNCELEFENNRSIRVFYKKKGAGEKLFRILSREDVRNSQRQRNYCILIIEQPLIDINRIQSSPINPLVRLINNSSNSLVSKFNTSTAGYETSFLYLDSLRQIAPAFTDLCTQLFLFNEKYVILPNYIEKAREKLCEYRMKFLQDSYRLLNKTFEDRDIELASEIFITGKTYTKVWPIIVQFTEYKDQTLLENIRRRQIKQHKCVPDTYLHTNQDALNGLKKLDDLKSSYEKAKSIRSALDSTLAAKTLRILDERNSTVSYHSPSDSMIMAADETLTAFIDVICQLLSTSRASESIRLVAHEYYTDKFRFVSLPQDVDYAFTTYRGAIEHLTSGAAFI